MEQIGMAEPVDIPEEGDGSDLAFSEEDSVKDMYLTFTVAV